MVRRIVTQAGVHKEYLCVYRITPTNRDRKIEDRKIQFIFLSLIFLSLIFLSQGQERGKNGLCLLS